MKTTLHLTLWVFLASYVMYSQNPIENCTYKFEVASNYLRDFGFASHVMVAEIQESISRCDQNTPNANYALGMLDRFYAKSEKDTEAAFDRIERAALQGHATAAKTLALMLKEGEGCIMNLETSEDWLKKAHKLGDSEAAYVLGYYYLKGLGSIRQSYNKAVRWFKKSHYPMAKHWLALCQHEGFGETQNREEALAALQKNEISNSLYLRDFLTNEAPDTTTVEHNNSIFEHLAKGDIQKQYVYTDNGGVTTSNQAYLVVWDWAKERIQQIVPMDFAFRTTVGETEFTVTREQQEITGSAVLLGDQAAFDGFSISLPNPFPDHEVERELFVDLFTAQFSQTLINDTPVVIAETEGWVANFNEPAPPISLVLIDPWDGLLQHEREAVKQDSHNIITNYPNQFTTDLIVLFELEQEADVQVNIYHFNQLDEYGLLPHQHLSAGEHIIRTDTSGWPSGLYVIQLFAGDQLHRKLILKEY